VTGIRDVDGEPSTGYGLRIDIDIDFAHRMAAIASAS
jgi:hypothetical protein